MIIGAMEHIALQEGVVRLTEWGVIAVRGPDAASYLHNLLTQDVTHLQPQQARLAGLCSPKGRLMASFIVCKASDDEFLLLCSADLLAATLKRLSMFVLRAKCKLHDLGAERVAFGLVGQSSLSWLGESAPSAAWEVRRRAADVVIRLPDADGQPRLILLQEAGAPAPALPALDAAHWSLLEVRSAVARVTAATAEQFVPQMVNFELVGGVNFQKGCYPGQEVVARSQYRGTLKRRAMLFGCDATLHAGQEVFHSDDAAQPAGIVVNAAPHRQGSTALVEVKLAALEGGALHAGAPDGPALRPLPLPYPLPVDATI